MKIIGLTGGVGSGKSEILEYLSRKYGATVCKTDEVAKKMQRKGQACYDQVVQHFGKQILDENGEINRDRLAVIVFNNADELQKLNEIVHPYVLDEVKKQIRKEEKKNTNLFIMESAILLNTLFEEICDELWFVNVNEDIRKNRLFYSRGYSEDRVSGIMQIQPEKEEFVKRCHRVIDNNGLFQETEHQIDHIMRNI